METPKELFHKYPNINPLTGYYITIGSYEYNRLVKNYGEPKIKSPKTNRLITVNKGTYKELLNMYSENELFHENKNIEIFPDDIILEEILKNTDIDNFINICKANKHYYEYCSNDIFWEKLYHKYYDNSRMYDGVKSYYETFKLCYQLDYLIKKLNLDYSIYNLSNITELDLMYKELSEIPKEIGQLQKLKILYLNNNNLNEIPKGIGQLKNLQELYLNHNKLSEIPKEIGQLKNLQELYLNHNKLSKIPKDIEQLQKLKILELEYNKLIEIP
jgi:hypothetical protein